MLLLVNAYFCVVILFAVSHSPTRQKALLNFLRIVMSQHIPSIFIAPSHLHNIGVFTAAAIPANSMIEICPILYIPREEISIIQNTIINDYYFEWDEDLEAGALALGYGSIYNHSFSPNAIYEVDMQERTLYITAYRDIEAGEEITINYNGDPQDQSALWFDTL